MKTKCIRRFFCRGEGIWKFLETWLIGYEKTHRTNIVSAGIGGKIRRRLFIAALLMAIICSNALTVLSVPIAYVLIVMTIYSALVVYCVGANARARKNVIAHWWSVQAPSSLLKNYATSSFVRMTPYVAMIISNLLWIAMIIAFYAHNEVNMLLYSTMFFASIWTTCFWTLLIVGMRGASCMAQD